MSDTITNRNPPYECYRCGYKTFHKEHMRNHLKRKTVCPATIHSIEMTETIKQEILRSRIYRPPPTPPVTHNISHQVYTQNNIGTIMNVICPNLSVEKRLSRFVQYNNKELVCLYDDIENMFEPQVRRFRDDKCFTGYYLDIDKLLEVFERILKLKYDDFTDMNIIYNKDNNNFNILDDTYEWEDFLLERGIKYIIEQVQDGYLHEYERYIVTKIRSLSGQDQQRYKEYIQEYYKFLASFDMHPLCSYRNKDINPEFLTDDVIDEFYTIYSSVKDNIRVTERNDLKRRFVEMIKSGCERNKRNFYQEFYKLYNTNENFKRHIESLDAIE